MILNYIFASSPLHNRKTFRTQCGDIKIRRARRKNLGEVPAEGASLGAPYSTYYTRVRVINNGGTTSGGSSVLRSLFPTPFYVDYDAVSSFQPPVTPRVPHSISDYHPSFPFPRVRLTRLTLFHLLAASSPGLATLALRFRGAYTQSTRPTRSMARRSPLLDAASRPAR